MYRKLPFQGGDARSVAEIVNNLVEGKSNNTGEITLAVGGVTSTTPVVSPTPTPDSVGTSLIPEYIWCDHRLNGRSVRSGTPYKPSCPKDFFARDYYGVPTEETIKLGLPKASPAPKVMTVKTCYKPSDKNRVNGVTVRKESSDGSQPKCPAGYK